MIVRNSSTSVELRRDIGILVGRDTGREKLRLVSSSGRLVSEAMIFWSSCKHFHDRQYTIKPLLTVLVIPGHVIRVDVVQFNS
jgi:hypothetical protein